MSGSYPTGHFPILEPQKDFKALKFVKGLVTYCNRAEHTTARLLDQVTWRIPSLDAQLLLQFLVLMGSELIVYPPTPHHLGTGLPQVLPQSPNLLTGQIWQIAGPEGLNKPGTLSKWGKHKGLRLSVHSWPLVFGKNGTCWVKMENSNCCIFDASYFPYPTEPFAILEPLNPSQDVPELN